MKKIVLTVSIFFSLSTLSLGQTSVDEVRIYFDDTQVNAKQVGMDLSASGRYLGFAFDDGTVRVFDTQINRFVSNQKLGYQDLFEMRFSKDENRLVLVSDTDWQMIDWLTSEVVFTQPLDSKPSRTTVGKQNDWLAIGTFNNDVLIYDLESLEKIMHETVKKGHHIGALDFSYDDKYILAYGKPTINLKGPLNIYDTNTGSLVATRSKAKSGANFSTNNDYKVHSYNYMRLEMEKWNFLNGTEESAKLKATLKDLIIPSNMIQYEDTYLVSGLYLGFAIYSAPPASDILFTTRKSKREDAKGGRSFAWQIGIDVNNIKRIPNTTKFIINSFGDNVNHIFDAKEKKIIGYFYTDSNDEFAVIARDGRVDGTTETFSKLAWTQRKSNQRLPLDVNLDKFITPRLYASLVNQGESKDISYINQAIQFAPSVSIITPDSISSTTKREIEISYRSESNGDPVSGVLVSINGKTIGSDTRGFKSAGEKITLTLVPGQNIIRLSAVSEKGYQSTADQIIINYSGQPASADLHILAIGLNQYKNPKYNLNYAKDDAKSFKETIEQGGSGIFSSVNTKFILDSEGTRDNILKSFKEISETIGPEDVFVFYYAGHGVMSEEDLPEFYIAPHNVTQLYGNNELLKEKGISANELREVSSMIQAQKQLFVLDACQSGGLTELLAMRGAAEEKAIAQLARSTGTFWLTASNSKQFATEFATLGHGLFTYALLEGLQGAADGGNRDKKITVRELSAYLNDRVPDLSAEYKGQPQYPTSYGFGGDFPLVIAK